MILKIAQIEQIAREILNKKIAVLPTDTIYGLHCLALEQSLINRIYELKQRPEKMPLITLISDISDLDNLGISLNNFEKDQTSKYWPGPNTLIINERSFRLPNNEFLNKLLQFTGPLVSTSANLHGQPNAKNVQEAQNYFGDGVDLYVDNGELNNPPSSIYKIEKDFVTKIR